MVEGLQNAPRNKGLISLFTLLVFLAAGGMISCRRSADHDGLGPVKILSQEESDKYRSLRERGLKEYFKRNSDEALRLLLEAKAINPRDPEIFNNVGIVYHQKKQYKKAVSTFEDGIRIDPYLPVLHMNLGRVYDEIGDFDKAASEFTQVIQLNPTRDEAYRHLGDIYHKTQRYDEAGDQYAKAIALNPDSGDAYMGIGRILIKQKKYRDAIAAFKALLQINPNIPEPYNQLSMIYQRLGEDELAQQYLSKYRERRKYMEDTRALELKLQESPKDPERILDELALRYSEQGRWQEAIEKYERLVELQPDNAETHYFLSIASSRMQQMRKARAEARRAVELDLQDPRFHYQLGVVDAQLGQTEPAIESMEKASALKPDDPQTLLSLGSLLIIKRRYSDAARNLERLVELAPDSVPAHEGLLNIYCCSDDLSLRDPQKALREAQTLKPLGSRDYTGMARAYELNGQRAAAVAILKEGVSYFKAQGAPKTQIQLVEQYLSRLSSEPDSG